MSCKNDSRWWLKSLVLIMAMAAVAPFVASKRSWATGGGDAGGGSGVVTLDGKVHLVDLIDPEKFDARKVIPWDRVAMVFSDSKYSGKGAALSSPGTPDLQFFTPAVQRFQKISTRYPFMKELANLIVELPAIAYEGRIFVKDPSPFISHSLDKFGVVPELLAVYSQNVVIYSKPLVDLMSPEHREALSVHEAYRRLNYMEAFKEPLTSENIEALTRCTVDKAFPSDSCGELFKAISPEFNQHTVLSNPERLQQLLAAEGEALEVLMRECKDEVLQAHILTLRTIVLRQQAQAMSYQLKRYMNQESDEYTKKLADDIGNEANIRLSWYRSLDKSLAPLKLPERAGEVIRTASVRSERVSTYGLSNAKKAGETILSAKTIQIVHLLQELNQPRYTVKQLSETDVFEVFEFKSLQLKTK